MSTTTVGTDGILVQRTHCGDPNTCKHCGNKTCNLHPHQLVNTPNRFAIPTNSKQRSYEIEGAKTHHRKANCYVNQEGKERQK